MRKQRPPVVREPQQRHERESKKSDGKTNFKIKQRSGKTNFKIKQGMTR